MKLLWNLGRLNMLVMQVIRCTSTWSVTRRKKATTPNIYLSFNLRAWASHARLMLSKYIWLYLLRYLRSQKVNFFVHHWSKLWPQNQNIRLQMRCSWLVSSKQNKVGIVHVCWRLFVRAFCRCAWLLATYQRYDSWYWTAPTSMAEFSPIATIPCSLDS